MLKITCPDGIDLKFVDEQELLVVVNEGELSVINKFNKEVLIRLAPGKWTQYLHVPREVFYTT